MIYIADESVITRTIMRKRHPDNVPEGVDLAVTLREIVGWANTLIPSEACSILFDDPILKLEGAKRGRLYFAACYGKNSISLIGTYIADDEGIAGETYKKGRSYICKDTEKDKRFMKSIDMLIQQKTVSIICSPIVINETVIGVIELINRKDKTNYDTPDLTLLEIFAGYIATLMENSLAAREFQALSISDNLTGLSNDRHFFACLEQEVDALTGADRDMALIFFDLDHFKDVNDTYGHIAGSRVLKELGGILKSIFSSTDAVVARYGGDEYVIILPGKDSVEGKRYAEIIRNSVADHVFLKNPGRRGEPALNLEGQVTCSVGISSYLNNVKPVEDTRLNAEALLRAADNAMYVAKAMGKNRIYVAEDMA